MNATLARILATDGSIRAIRGLQLSNEELIAAIEEIAALPGYHGRVECEPDAVTGEILPVRERVTPLRALASAIALALRQGRKMLTFTDSLVSEINAALEANASTRRVYRHESEDRLQIFRPHAGHETWRESHDGPQPLIDGLGYVSPKAVRGLTAQEIAAKVDRVEKGAANDWRDADPVLASLDERERDERIARSIPKNSA